MGELWVSLIRLWNYHYLFADSPLVKGLEEEILEQAKFIDKNYKLVETEKTYTRNVKRLEWIGE